MPALNHGLIMYVAFLFRYYPLLWSNVAGLLFCSFCLELPLRAAHSFSHLIFCCCVHQRSCLQIPNKGQRSRCFGKELISQDNHAAAILVDGEYRNMPVSGSGQTRRRRLWRDECWACQWTERNLVWTPRAIQNNLLVAKSSRFICVSAMLSYPHYLFLGSKSAFVKNHLTTTKKFCISQSTDNNRLHFVLRGMIDGIRMLILSAPQTLKLLDDVVSFSVCDLVCCSEREKKNFLPLPMFCACTKRKKSKEKKGKKETSPLNKALYIPEWMI